MIKLNKDNYQEVIQENDFVLVDFWAPWCGPCKMVKPVLEELEKEMDNVTFTEFNTDESQIPAGLAISAIPTILLYKDGVLVDTIKGALPKIAIKDRIDKKN